MMAKLLIADDNAAIREILQIAADAAGFTAVLASDGEEAWQIFTEGGIDLLLLDVMMPGLDGFALCQRIRRESDVPIIMITARGEIGRAHV